MKSAFAKHFFIKRKLTNANLCQIIFYKDAKRVCPNFVCNEQERVCQSFFVNMKNAYVQSFCNDQQHVCQTLCVKAKSAFAKTFFIKRKLANANLCQILFCKDEKRVCPKFVCDDQ